MQSVSLDIGYDNLGFFFCLLSIKCSFLGETRTSHPKEKGQKDLLIVGHSFSNSCIKKNHLLLLILKDVHTLLMQTV